MNIYFLIAGTLCFLLGIAHSTLGEYLIFNNKRKAGNLVSTNESCSELLLKKNPELKKLLIESIECEDKTINATIRKAIWNHFSDDLQLNEIEIAKLDAKNTWEQLKKHMPLYSLFQSDRKNSDGDSEVQNPMKLAV